MRQQAGTGVIVSPGGEGVLIGQVPGSPTPTEILEGFKAQRAELYNQLEGLEDRRDDIERDLRQGNVTEASRAGLEARIADIDKRITALDVQIAQAEAQVAAASAVPGAVVPPPPEPPYVPRTDWNEIAGIGMFLTAALLLPVTLAWTRRIWRRSAKIVTAIPNELIDRFNRLEHAVDSIAIEVERIGEGQRFMTRVLAEHGVPREQIPASLTDELNLPPETSSRRRP